MQGVTACPNYAPPPSCTILRTKKWLLGGCRLLPADGGDFLSVTRRLLHSDDFRVFGLDVPTLLLLERIVDLVMREGARRRRGRAVSPTAQQGGELAMVGHRIRPMRIRLVAAQLARRSQCMAGERRMLGRRSAAPCCFPSAR